LTRWLLSGRLVSGQLPATGQARAQARPASRSPRAGRDGWDPRDDRSPLGNPGSRRDPGLLGGRRPDGTGPSQAFRGERERRDTGTWPGQGMRDERDTWDRGPGGDPRDRRPRDRRDDPGPYDAEDPRGDRRPRDLW